MSWLTCTRAANTLVCLLVLCTVGSFCSGDANAPIATESVPNLTPMSPSSCQYFNGSACKNARVRNNSMEIQRDCSPRRMYCSVDPASLKRAYCFSAHVVGVPMEEDDLRFGNCWLGESGACEQDNCTITKKVRVKNSTLATCCCRQDMCNSMVIDNMEEPSGDPITDIEPLETGAAQDNNTVYIIAVPLLIVGLICMMSVVACIRKKHFRHSPALLANEDLSLVEDDAFDDSNLEPLVVHSEGRYGKVCLGGEVNGVKVAIKSFANKKSWLQERDIYKLPGMQHENIARFIGARQKGEGNNLEMWIVMEFYPNGSIYDYLKGHVLTWPQMLHLAHSLMQGLAYLHNEVPLPNGLTKYSVAHRDIKSKNILLKDDFSAAIADFGLAEKFGRTADTHIQAGTHRYMAPEVLEGAISFTKDSFLRIDVYAAALVLWELVTRCQISEIAPADYKLPFEKEIGNSIASLDIMQNLVVNQRLRPCFPDCLNRHTDGLTLMRTIDESWDQDAEARLSADCIALRLASLFKNVRNVCVGETCAVQNMINHAHDYTVVGEESQRLIRDDIINPW